MEEFKKFITRGNVMDLAIGIMIGGAFTSIVNSFVGNIISPIIGMFGSVNFTQWQLPLRGDAVLLYGQFISDVINFLILALILFLIMKAFNGFADKISKKKEEPKKIRKCSFCKCEIDDEATRCPHCTSILEETN